VCVCVCVCKRAKTRTVRRGRSPTEPLLLGLNTQCANRHTRTVRGGAHLQCPCSLAAQQAAGWPYHRATPCRSL